MADPAFATIGKAALPATGAPAVVATPPAPAATVGQPLPETDPAYLAFANGQGWREAEARSYTALRQNAIHQAYQDQLPGMILSGQQQMLGTTNQFGGNGAWRTGARIQQQGRDEAGFQAKVTQANDAQQQQQNDLAAQLAAHISNLRMDTSQARLEAANNAALSQAGMGQQAYVSPAASQSSAANPNNSTGA